MFQEQQEELEHGLQEREDQYQHDKTPFTSENLKAAYTTTKAFTSTKNKFTSPRKLRNNVEII